MRRGSAIALHSTVRPATSQDLSIVAADRGIVFVDAPVSGGRPAAEQGNLTVMLGGEKAAVAAMRPVLETFASFIVHLGPVGSAQAAKLINNSLLGANLGLVHMAMRAGRRLGLDRHALLELVERSSGRSFASDTYSRQIDLAAFQNRLRLFDQVELLGSVLGTEDHAYRKLHDSAAALFGDRSLAQDEPDYPARAAHLSQGADVGEQNAD
jgi:3-hydroxyisobutyrate dehydrogenase-like beta-hydroxyacid dehydrogenase